MRSDLAGPPVALALLASVAAGLVLASVSSWSGRPGWVGSGYSSFSMHQSREGVEADSHRGLPSAGEQVPEADDDGYVEGLTRILGNDPAITGAVPRGEPR